MSHKVGCTDFINEKRKEKKRKRLQQGKERKKRREEREQHEKPNGEMARVRERRDDSQIPTPIQLCNRSIVLITVPYALTIQVSSTMAAGHSRRGQSRDIHL